MKKYEYKFGDIPIESDDVDVINDILEYSEDNPNFDPSFTESVQKHMWKEGFISGSQYRALLNIYYGFQMDKPKEKTEIRKIGEE